MQVLTSAILCTGICCQYVRVYSNVSSEVIVYLSEEIFVVRIVTSRNNKVDRSSQCVYDIITYTVLRTALIPFQKTCD